ncbi:MAG TPA: Rrf2 family transcriptional regulator [Verrucomicrobiae bacterium]|nr:Rrf2 family transcriptional regulator [Verrucomicrobiae bacterium]
MQLTRAADYAVRVMIHLAGLPADARVSRSELSAAAECPEQFLSKVLQNLTRAGLIVSHRGNTGGFELDSRHREATLLQVVEAIEGPIRLNLCLNSDQSCSRQGWCPAHPVWAKAQQAMVEVLSANNISELAQRAQESRPKNPLVSDKLQWN